MKQLELGQRPCAACEPQQRYLHRVAGPTQVQKEVNAHKTRRRIVSVRAEADYGEQHPVLTAPLRDGHQTLR
jgi:hypothetical protein